MDLALNNLQRLACHENTNKQTNKCSQKKKIIVQITYSNFDPQIRRFLFKVVPLKL